MKIKVTDKWIEDNKKQLLVINVMSSDKPGKLNTFGKYLNKGVFVLKTDTGNFFYDQYMDRISIRESEETFIIEDSATLGELFPESS